MCTVTRPATLSGAPQLKHDDTSAAAYLASLPDDRREAMIALRNTILTHLPRGFVEAMSYGMIGYVVPHDIYPAGYHCDPAQPLPFLSIASQKSHIALYHMGLYADPDLLAWFEAEWAARDLGKLDMGKSCIRFKKPERIPLDLIGDLVERMSAERWIAVYEASRGTAGSQ